MPVAPPDPKEAVGRLLGFAGPRKKLAVLGCVLAGVNGVFVVMPLVCVWFVLRDLVAVAPNWSAAEGLAFWGWLAFAFSATGLLVYFAALMCTHLAAFRTAANMRKQALGHLGRVPLGYFDSHASGHLRRVVDGCAGQTEDMLAHKLPDFVGSLVTPVAFVAVMFAFDWIMGLVCLVPIAISALMMWWMMGRRTKNDGMPFMMLYQDALNRMNKAAVEYVRGIPVVKVFQQTVHSFRAFSEAIMSYRDMAYQYSKSCQRPQVVQLVAINGTFAVLVPAGILLAHAAGDFAAFLTDFLFYAVFSAITTTMMTKMMYASEAVMMAQDSVRRIDEILATRPLAEPSAVQAGHPRDGSISFEHVGFAYPGASGDALVDMSLEVPAGSTVALVGPSGGGKTTAASLVPRFWDVDSGSVSVGGVDVRDIPASELMDAAWPSCSKTTACSRQSLLPRTSALPRPGATRAGGGGCSPRRAVRRHHGEVPRRLGHAGRREGRVPLGRRVPAYRARPGHPEGRPHRCARRGHGVRRPGERGPHPNARSARLCEGKTVLMIAHRLSTVAGADVICVLDEGPGGRAAARHAELVAAGGLYAKMWNDYRTSVSWRIGKERYPCCVSKFALTEQGRARFQARRAGLGAMANVVLMAPIGVLFTATGAISWPT